MGCTQSTERKPVAQQQLPKEFTTAPASPVKVAAVVQVASPVQQKDTQEAPAQEFEAIQFVAVSEQPSAAESVAVSPLAAEPAVEEPAAEIEVCEAPAEQTPGAPVEEVKVVEVKAVEPIAVAAPTIPLLALASANKKPKKSPRVNKMRNDENAGSPVTQSALKAVFGTSKASGNTIFATKKVVAFDAVPAQASVAVKQAKAKAKARKAAGKRAGNFDHEKFLEQCAAFERQLTHRATLDAHLNSR